MDQQDLGDMSRYIVGSEAHLNHHTLAENEFGDDFSQFHDMSMLGNDDMTFSNLATGQQQPVLENGFIDNSHLELHAQQFPQTHYTYPPVEAPRPNGPYYLNHQLTGTGGLAEPNLQFQVFHSPSSYLPAQLTRFQPQTSAPQNVYNQPGHQPPQNLHNGSIPIALTPDEFDQFRLYQKQKALSQRALPPSQPNQSHYAAPMQRMPGALENSEPPLDSMPSSSPLVDDFSRVSWKRKDIRENNASADPTKFYTERFPKVPGWGQNVRTQELGFRYTDVGQWNENISVGKNQLKFYLDNCPRKLRVYVQNAPSQANHRTDIRHDRKCRYNRCPTKQGTVLAGWFRVVFDEFPELTSKGKKDPFKVAGAMHLWCFEQCVDPAVYFHKGILKPDVRALMREEKNPMSLERDAGNRDIVAKTFNGWMMSHTDTGTQPFPRAHKDSLSFALCSHHVLNQTATRQQSRDKRNKRRPAAEKKTMDIHMGDLSSWCRAARLSKRRQARDEFDESEVDAGGEEDDSARDAMQAVASHLPSAIVDSTYTLATGPRNDLNVEPEYNAPSNPLGALTANHQYNTAFDPLGAPPVALQQAPPGDGLPIVNDIFQLDGNSFPIDPELTYPFENYEMPDYVEENHDAVMEGILTPRSLSCVEDHVEVQKEGSPQSANSLFGSPPTSNPTTISPKSKSPTSNLTTISPKPKSPTKKRRRSKDEDEEYVPKGSPKRQLVMDSSVPQTRRRSSTRSCGSLGHPDRRRSSPRSLRNSR